MVCVLFGEVWAVVTSGHAGAETVTQTLPVRLLFCFGNWSVSNKAHRLNESDGVKHRLKHRETSVFSKSLIVKRCRYRLSVTARLLVHLRRSCSAPDWIESTTTLLAQWKMWVRYQQTSLAGNKVPSLNRAEEIWVIRAEERSRAEGEHKCFWQRLINDAVCAEPGF